MIYQACTTLSLLTFVAVGSKMYSGIPAHTPPNPNLLQKIYHLKNMAKNTEDPILKFQYFIAAQAVLQSLTSVYPDAEHTLDLNKIQRSLERNIRLSRAGLTKTEPKPNEFAEPAA